jgi:Na+/H+ antiporter NhaD/arsenite permease-like protein
MNDFILPGVIATTVDHVEPWFMILGSSIFILTYLAIAFEKQIRVDKTISAMFGSSLMLFFILESPQHGGEGAAQDAYSYFVDFNVIFLLAGMMLIVNLLRETGVFEYLAIRCAKAGRGQPLAVLTLLLVVTAVLSAFLDNVTTVLLIAPVTFLVAEQLNAPPLMFLIPEALASNIGGTATLIGDPPNILIGSYAKLDFVSFLQVLTPFICVLMAMFIVILLLLLRGKITVTAEQRARVMDLNEKRAITNPRLLKKSLFIVALTLAGFMLHGVFRLEPGVVAMGGAALLLLLTRANVEKALEGVEWPTLFFFLGLFIVVNGGVKAGLIDLLAEKAMSVMGSNPYVAAVALLWISGICAGIMNNVSFTAAALPVVKAVAASFPTVEAAPFWWALALGACLGGNLTPVGAAANLVICNISAKSGKPISFGQFMRWGAPCAIGSLILASGYICLLVRWGTIN